MHWCVQCSQPAWRPTLQGGPGREVQTVPTHSALQCSHVQFSTSQHSTVQYSVGTVSACHGHRSCRNTVLAQSHDTEAYWHRHTRVHMFPKSCCPSAHSAHSLAPAATPYSSRPLHRASTAASSHACRCRRSRSVLPKPTACPAAACCCATSPAAAAAFCCCTQQLLQCVCIKGAAGIMLLRRKHRQVDRRAMHV